MTIHHSDVWTSKLDDMTNRPGTVRDAILDFMAKAKRPVKVAEIYAAVDAAVGEEVPRSSIRSYLNFNTPETFTRTGRGEYKLT